jgi:hypothetical protein
VQDNIIRVYSSFVMLCFREIDFPWKVIGSFFAVFLKEPPVIPFSESKRINWDELSTAHDYAVELSWRSRKERSLKLIAFRE